MPSKPLITLLARAGAFSLALALAACGAARQAPPDVAADKAFKVVTTFLPITLFTRAVAGDCATVTALIPPSLGPHDFQAKPGDLTALRQAGVLVKNGLEMEGFLGKLVACRRKPPASGDRLQPRRHHPGVGGAQAMGMDMITAAVNPHIWLDPLRAVQQVATIRDGLIQADPSCADGYRRNAAAFTAQLKQLNSEIASQLEPYRGKTFVAFHDFAPYFAQRYGLKADYLVDVPELNPSPADLQRVAAEVKSSQLKALLSEPQEGNRSFNTLAKDLGVKVVVFDPMETATEEASRESGHLPQRDAPQRG